MKDNNNLRMTLKAALDNLWSRISGIFGTVNGRIDDAEAHIDSVESAVDGVTTRVTSVEGRMTTAEGQITGLDNRVDDLEDVVDDLEGDMIKSISLNGVNVPKDAQGNVALQETDPTVPAWAKAASKPTYTSQEVGAKAVQTAVVDPTASGNSISFIDSITQDAQGVISPTKKSVPNASTTAAGLMSASDKTKLDGLDMLGFYIDNSGYICQRIGSDT